MIVASPIGIITPDTANLVRIEAPTSIGISNTTIGVLFIKALRIAPATSVASNAPHDGRQRFQRSRGFQCLADHHQRGDRNERFAAEAREKVDGLHHDLAVACIGEQFEPGDEYDQDCE
jgi:threonine dehydrogenase-like Zn-dependent dehydrogenase